MTTLVGIFDSGEDLDAVAKRLAAAGFDAAILDEAILAQEPSADPALPALVPPGAAPELAGGTEEPSFPRRDKQSVLRDFKTRLTEDYRLSDDVIEPYATTLAHGGKFAFESADAKSVEGAMQILRECGATRVNRHD